MNLQKFSPAFACQTQEAFLALPIRGRYRKEEDTCQLCFSLSSETFILYPSPLPMLVEAVTQHPLVKHKYSQYACNYLQNGMGKILMANFLCIYYAVLCYSTSRKHFECAKMKEQGQIVKSVGYVAGQNVHHLPLTLIS